MFGKKYQMGLNEVLVLKGISILAIILHNFIHHFPGVVLENQHIFYSERNYKLIESVLRHSPDLLLDLISYYGHYGVPVFVFLSGYGLVMKYEKNGVEIKFVPYMKRHLVKLWFLLLPLMILLYFLRGIEEPSYLREHWLDLFLMAGFVSNLTPNFYFFHGPWWFFSLIVQLYVVYYICVYKHTLRPIIILTMICLCGQIIVIGVLRDIHLLEYLRYNFVGSVLPFALGVVFARKKYFPTNTLAILAFVIFIICCFNEFSWLLTFGLITVAILPIAGLVRLNSYLFSFFKWLGTLSAFLFVSHPIARTCILGLNKFFFFPMSVLSIIGYIFFSILLAWIYKKLLVWIQNKF